MKRTLVSGTMMVVALAAIAALSIVFYILGISIGFLRTYATYHFLK